MNVLSPSEVKMIVDELKDSFTQIFLSKKYSNKYKETADYILNNFSGDKFTERVYKYVYGSKTCKQCGILLTSKQFKSFFSGYCGEFCSKKCAYKHPSRVNNIKNTKFDKYGDSCYNNQSKLKHTMIDKYGVEHNWSKNSPLRENCYITNQNIHGDRNWNNVEKKKQTCKEIYGVDSFSKTEIFKKMVSSTNVKKYGCEYYVLAEDFQKKSMESSIKKYGVPYPMQNQNVADKGMEYKNWKEYTFPSGQKVKIQGYEGYALNILLTNHDENDILLGRKFMPEIWYHFEGKNRRYYPDVYIKKDNKIIEIKSEYTFNIEKEKNLIKHEMTKKLGYLHEIWIFDKKKKLTETIT